MWWPSCRKKQTLGCGPSPGWLWLVGHTQRITDLRNGRYGISDSLGYLELGTWMAPQTYRIRISRVSGLRNLWLSAPRWFVIIYRVGESWLRVKPTQLMLNCILLYLPPQLVLLHQLSSLEAQTERSTQNCPKSCCASGLVTSVAGCICTQRRGISGTEAGGLLAKLTRGSYTSWLGSCCACHLNKTESFLLPKDQVRFLSFCETELLTPSKEWTSCHWAFWAFYRLAWDWCCPWWVPSGSSWAWCCVGHIHGRHTYHLLFPSWKGHVTHLKHSQSVEQWLAQIQLIF